MELKRKKTQDSPEGNGIQEKKEKVSKQKVDSLKREKTSYNGAELVAMKITEIPTLVEPILPKVGLISLIGTSDLGKSTLLLQLCLDVALNKEFLGMPIKAVHKSSLMVCTEDNQFDISFRLQKYSGCDVARLKNFRCIFNRGSLITTIKKELAKQRVDIIVIDTFSDVYSGDMNQVTQVRSFMDQFTELAIKYQCLVILNHHTGKHAEERPPHKANSIGSTGFVDKCRLVMELRRDWEDESKRHLCIVKGNNLSSDFKGSSYELDFSPDMIFTKTGNRVEFDKLVKPKEYKQPVSRDAEKKLAMKLRLEGNSTRQVTTMLNEKGIIVGKSTVAEWTRELPVQNIPSNTMDTGQGDVTDGLSVQQTSLNTQTDEQLKILSIVRKKTG